LLKEAEFSFGFCCESVDCASHSESPKHAAFSILNNSTCAPTESGGTSPYSESDGVPAITVHFYHVLPRDLFLQRFVTAFPAFPSSQAPRQFVKLVYDFPVASLDIPAGQFNHLLFYLFAGHGH